MLDFGHFLAMKTCPSVNFYSVQISPNTSPAHRFHWLARPNFAKQGSGSEFAGIRKLGRGGAVVGRLS